MSDSLLSFYRKIRVSIVQRGVVRTLSHAGIRLNKIMFRLVDEHFDRRHGTDTSGKIELSELSTLVADTSECIWYEPIPIWTFRCLIAQVHLDFSRYTFVDFGSGKGRALMLAAEKPFRRVVGIEFAKELFEIARRNIERCGKRRVRCRSIETRLMNATDFPIPLEPCLFYFYSPFYSQVMGRVLANIKVSLVERPRDAAILFYGGNQDAIRRLRELGWQEKKLRYSLDFRYQHHKYGILFVHRADPDYPM